MFEVHLTLIRPMRRFHGGNGKLATPLQNFNRPGTRRRRHDLEAVRDVKQRLSRNVEAAEFSSRNAFVIASRCLSGEGAAVQNPQFKIVIHDILTMCAPDDSLAVAATMRNFLRLCPSHPRKKGRT